jgi:hypothetical protein
MDSKKKYFMMAATLSLLMTMSVLTGCTDNSGISVEEPMLQGKISSYNEFDGAMLDFTEADMEKAGFTLGDLVSITLDGKTYDVPYYNGYYNRNGELLCVAYPSYPSISFTATNTGLPQELKGLEGHSITIRIKQKGGCLDVQKAMSLSYTYDRNNYADISDAQFANARAVKAGKIVSGVLHRSTTPFSNIISRCNYVSEYLEKSKVKTVLNLADTEEDILSYDMPPYSRSLWDEGNVILCPLKANPTADDFNNRLIAALKELPKHPAPYVVHCMEGKDRTGYVCALLEGLCGATYEEMVADYLTTYDNFYGVTPEKDRDVCDMLVVLKLNPCLMFYAGVSDEAQLPNIDYAKAFSDFLLSHGMSRQELDALIQVLTTN